MSSQYDSIAGGYQQTKQSPLRQYVEAYTFFNLLGDVKGLSVLDLACGEGFYTRGIRGQGAARVLGIDISAEMIALARQQEKAAALGIEYRVGDVAEMNPDERFDLVSAAYLLHYAVDVQQLGEMCRRIASSLRPGGRLVSISENPAQPLTDYAAFAQYGFNKEYLQPGVNGSEIRYSMVAGTQLIRFEARYYTRDTYEQALRAAGFTEVRWHELQLDPQGAEVLGAEYWRAYLDNPPVVGLEALL